MAFCTKCGNQLSDSTRFCTTCGAEAPAAAAYAPPVMAEPVQAGSFFSLSEYVIDEKVSAFKFTNAYKVFDAEGQLIGSVEQQGVSTGQKAARLLFGNNIKSMFAFTLDIKDAQGNVAASIQRDGASSGLMNMRTMRIMDAAGNQVGALQFVFSWVTPKMDILDAAGQVIARIAGDWKGWNFSITDTAGREIGSVNKKWNGAMKEMFTTADKYRVSIDPQAVGVHRVAIIAAAVTIDMVLKESK